MKNVRLCRPLMMVNDERIVGVIEHNRFSLLFELCINTLEMWMFNWY